MSTMNDNQQMNFPRILIVGTLPYHPNESSRALDTYFHNWDSAKLRMIYSNSKPPFNDFCGSYFRITDTELFRNFFNRKHKVGSIINPIDNYSTNSVDESSIMRKFKKKTIFRFYARKWLWNKKRWLTNELINWVDEFKPEAIYVCFSDDYFILDISYFFANKYKIPMIVQIGDDYFFKKHNFFLKPYIRKYKILFNKIMNTKGFGVYISDKLSEKYNSFFPKIGFSIYLGSNIKPKESNIKYEFNYFGKINLGRLKSITILGDALNRINKAFYISIYSQSVSKKELRCLKKHHCRFCGSIPYNVVSEKMNSGAFNIVASGFSKKNIEESRYSLSTKIADSLISCGPIIAIGPQGDGAIDYLCQNKCAIVLNKQKIDINYLSSLLSNADQLRKLSETATDVYNSNHLLLNNRSKFELECMRTCEAKE